MKEKKYGIIGNPLSHSISPTIHNFWFKKYNINANYSLIKIKIDEIENIINKIKKGELQGINVTIPFKQAVIPYLDKVINDANETQSVNTIYLNQKNEIIGENTDVYGFNEAFIKRLGKNLTEKKVLILGAGGVAPSIIFSLAKKNIKKIFISNRTLKKAENMKSKFPFIETILWEDFIKVAENMDIIINTTSLGMRNGNNFEKTLENFKSTLVYYDIIYNPTETPMIKHLSKKGIKTFNGLDMLILQGQKSFFLWNNINPEFGIDLKKIIMSEIK
ncbi:shikimate dehydrogenase [Pelagibacteraceae bacterium]|jgi:shikimate dehydrogenase|nr:shikimate dehydrogenase [Pelagibacteraceae bacterium]